MNIQLFDIDKFNIIQDEEYYYLFRAFNNADNKDIENGTIIDWNGFTRIRTDRERWEEDEGKPTPKYSREAEISLEQVYDHIKMRYRKDTNCVSLSSNANVSIVYGRGNYADRYAMIKIPKREMGEKVFNAGQYMLQEISDRVDTAISELDGSSDTELLEKLSQIDNVDTIEEINDIVKELYSKLNEDNNKNYRGKKVNFASMTPVTSRISSYQSLSEEQTLEKNKVVAKLTVLELSKRMKSVIPHTKTNINLIRTLGNAFSSSEQVYYGDIPGDQVTEISKEMMDILALLQQQDKSNPAVAKIERELLTYINEGYHIEENEGRLVFTNGTKTIDLNGIEESFLHREDKLTSDMTIENMYEATKGRVSYQQATSLVKKIFYLSKSKGRAREFSEILNKITENNSEYQEVIQSMYDSGFEIEPEIITRQNYRGYKLSEAVSLDLKKDEYSVLEYIKSLDNNELVSILENGGMSDIDEMISRHFSDAENLEPTDKNTYYANAIIDSYNWGKVGIEFTEEEREEIGKRLQKTDCIELYTKLKEHGIEEKDIPVIALNIATREKFANIFENGKFEASIEELKQNLSIEQVERYLGYFDIPNTGITLKEYQQRAVDKADRLFEEKRFASIILPTGAGKSYVALDQLLKHKDESMAYFAPSNEILEQIKDKIVKSIHGKEGTLGKSKDEIVKEIFPQLSFETYQSLLQKSPEELQETKYQFMVLDELHRTGAEKWGRKLDTLLESQDENFRALGITATPQRDRGGKDMAYETASKLGYTEEELRDDKHIAMEMNLMDAIRARLVVNPLLVSCKYNLTQDGTLERLVEKIQTVQDKEKRQELENKYNSLRKQLDNAEGIPELLESSITKKDGKYIVFVPVSENGQDLEDEDGNVNKNGKKKSKQKIEEAQKQIAEWLKNVDAEPELYSMLGDYGNKKNAKQLHDFENSKSEHIKVMVVMNKLNEGIHVDGIDGIIWQRALDEDSKILLLQQLGRCIYAIGEDYTEDKRPIVIDLPNNMMKINLNKELNTYTPKGDLILLEDAVEWVHRHNERIPDINSTSREEARKASTLKRIQEKYSAYLEEFGDELDQEDIDKIQKIISLGEEIDLWNEEFPEKENKEQDVDIKIDTFELKGILKEVYEFEQELDVIEGKSAVEIFIKKVEKLHSIGVDVSKIMGSDTIKSLAEKSGIQVEQLEKLGFDLNENIGRIRVAIALAYRGSGKYKKPTEQQVTRLLELGIDLNKRYKSSLESTLEIQQWCEEKYKGKKYYERRLPNSKSKDDYESKLGIALQNIRSRLKRYDGVDIEKIENEDDREIIQIIKKLDQEYNLDNNVRKVLIIKEWFEETYKDKKIYERNLPNRRSKNEIERKMGINLARLENYMAKYREIEIEQIKDENDRKVVEILRMIQREYGLSAYLKNALKIEEWCKENFGDKKICERRLPSQHSKDEYEKSLGVALCNIRKSIKKCKSLNEDEKRIIVEIVRRLDSEYNYRVIKSQDIGKATFDASTKECDEAQGVLERDILMQKSNDRGEQI